jgi:hypothetical protein
MTKVNIRTVTGFMNNPNTTKMSRFIDSVGKIEKTCKIRTKRLAINIDDFSDSNITEISKETFGSPK